jgi:hypothetical protein
MGFPKKFVLEKYSADTEFYKLRRPFEELEKRLENSAFPEKRRLKPDYIKVNDMLDELLPEIFRSDEFIQLKMMLKTN